MSDEKPVRLKRKVSTSAFSVDNDMICIVHYDHSRDVEIRPLSESHLCLCGYIIGMFSCPYFTIYIYIYM